MTVVTENLYNFQGSNIAIPVVDIAALRDGSDPELVAAALYKANTELGFLYVAGHGIDCAQLDEARAEALAFFRQSSEEKDRVRISKQHRGWLPIGQSKMDDDVAADLKESYVWGFESAPIEGAPDHPLRGTNQWPHYPPTLKSACDTWFNAAHEVAFDLLRGFALGLNCAEDQFVAAASDLPLAGAMPLSRASLVYYPPQAYLAAPRVGVSEHTDFGVLTVLFQDSVGGLQVRTARGDWIDAPPIADTLIVNVGDLLHRWTNGTYLSTPHRVVNRSAEERLSFVLAYDPPPQTLIDARVVLPGATDYRFEPITCGDYLTWRFGKAFTYAPSSRQGLNR